MTRDQRTDKAAARLAAMSLARCGDDIEAHLDPISDMGRQRCRQDAA